MFSVVSLIKQMLSAVAWSGVSGGESRVLTLPGAEHPDRVLLETINEGAATLNGEGTVLYANARFAEFLNVSVGKFVGTPLRSHVSLSAKEKLSELLE